MDQTAAEAADLQKLSKNELIEEIINLRKKLQIYSDTIKRYDASFDVTAAMQNISGSVKLLSFETLSEHDLYSSNIEAYAHKLLQEMDSFPSQYQLIPKVDLILDQLCKNDRMDLYKTINQRYFHLDTPASDDVERVIDLLSNSVDDQKDADYSAILNTNTLTSCLAFLRSTDKIRHQQLMAAIFRFLDRLAFDDPSTITTDKKLIVCKVFVQMTQDRMNRMNLNLSRAEWAAIHAKAIASLKTLGTELDAAYETLTHSDGDFRVLIGVENQTLIDRQDDDKVTPLPWYIDPMQKVDESKYLQHVQELGITKANSSYGWQVYIDFLRKVGEKINGNFQETVRSIVGADRFSECKIKSSTRMMNKMDEYKREGKAAPYLAHLLDVVRCCCFYETPTQLVQGLEAIKENFNVVRLKNTFYKDAKIEYGYRAVYCNVLYEYKGTKMICEVQLTLTKFKQVAKKMHLYYKICRAQNAREVGYDMS